MVEVPSTVSIYLQQLQLRRQNSLEMQGKLRDIIKEITQEQMQMSQEQMKNGNNSPEAMKEDMAKSNEKAMNKLNEYLNKTMDENNKKVEDLTSRLNEERRNIQVKQEKLAFGISRISPTAVFTLAATTISGTSLELRAHFQERAAAYSETFAEFLREKTGRNVGGQRIIIRLSADEEEKKPPKPINPREIPEFLYEAHELPDILQASLPDIAILMIFNLIFFCGAFLAFLRYDLR